MIDLRCALLALAAVALLGQTWSGARVFADEFANEPTVVATLKLDELCMDKGLALLLEDRVSLPRRVQQWSDGRHRLIARYSAKRAIITIIPRSGSTTQAALAGEIPMLLSAVGKCPSAAKRLPAGLAVKGLHVDAPTPEVRG